MSVTIFGVDVGTFVFPDGQNRPQNISVGRASDGSFQFKKFRASDRELVIGVKLSTTSKNTLIDTLEADANYQGAVVPPANIDLGAGAGNSVNVQWAGHYQEEKILSGPAASDMWLVVFYFTKV